MSTPDPSSTPFLESFRGAFTATLRWPELDRLWERVRERAGDGWYLYAVGEPLPSEPAGADDVLRFIAELDRLLRAEHQESFCGIVYADDLRVPRMIKVYDPNNLGVVCGFSDSPPLPGWVLSLLPPVDLPSAQTPPGRRRRWWHRLTGGAA